MHKGLELKNIKKIYQDDISETTAIKNFSYTFSPESFTSIIGPSGCGKSTLLSIIAGLEKINEGEILFNNIPFDNENFNIGYMLQKDYLLEWRTIYKNILFGLEVKNRLNDKSIDYAINLLKKYDLYEFKNKYPSQLSGGMRQRVSLIRTLAINPDILLLDEAFSALDYQTRLSVTEDVYKIIKNEKKITIMVTHDIPESITMSDNVIVLSQRPATIKNVHNIHFDLANRTPLQCRDAPEFSNYFDKIWKELN
ncbi:MAG: ABC transporter ATP-binding protein [Clostridia bacterium]|nr:ABC transporter ATP-binding protein [Clostridia bacterium]